MGILKKISSVTQNRTTYRVGLLQAKAYRVLKQRTADVLKPHGISTFEWAFVGMLSDKESMRSKDAALELGVEAPFVTQMVASLKKKGLVTERKSLEDSRAKAIALSEDGRAFVAKLEPIVRAHMRPLLQNIGVRDLLGYLAVLEKITENDRAQNYKA